MLCSDWTRRASSPPSPPFPSSPPASRSRPRRWSWATAARTRPPPAARRSSPAAWPGWASSPRTCTRAACASGTRFAFGVGGGSASTGLRYGTLDASLFLGNANEAFRLYGGPILALSVPFEKGDEIHDDRPGTSGYGGLAGGFEVPVGDAVAWSFELALGCAANRDEGAFLVGAATALRVRVPGS